MLMPTSVSLCLQDRMVGVGEVECPVGSREFQRNLGWVYVDEPPYPSTPLFR
jgi:hypothetical protein